MSIQPEKCLSPFLKASTYIDHDHPSLKLKAEYLAKGAVNAEEVVRNVYLFVRDEIDHPCDIKRDIITSKASDVLLQAAGYCYAQSHLVAALLRANHIPTALLYQRQCLDEVAGDFCLHGLNAVYLPEYGWHTIDARGKVDAFGERMKVQESYSPPHAIEVFDCNREGEYYLPTLFLEPLAHVVQALESAKTRAELDENLPDARA